MQPINRASPFFSASFLSRLQKMIATPRGPATAIEKAIEHALRRIAAIFTS
jgi:hypothetical protein